VCQLLCYITRREHVMEFRIHKLLSLLKSVGVNDQPIVSLLWAFRVYRPDLLSLSMKSGRMALFKSVDRSLAADIKRVQDKRMTAGRQVLLSKARQVTSSSKRRRLTSTEDIIESLEKVEVPKLSYCFMACFCCTH
jgi:hypothetical protein